MAGRIHRTDIPPEIRRKYPIHLWRFLCHCLKCNNWWLSDNLMRGREAPRSCSKCHRYDWTEPRKLRRRR